MAFRLMRRFALVLVALAGLFAATSGPALADVERDIVVTNPATDLWRAVRQREAPMVGVTQSQGVAAGQLINQSGEEWRLLRREKLIPIGGLVLAAVAGIVALLFLVRPSVPIPGGPTDRRLKRFDISRRMSHWFMAGVMLFLGVTGLVLLFGRFVLLPWMGGDAFGALASAAKEGHDLFGPLFVVALLVFFVHYVRKNLPHLRDINWLLRLGGIFSHREVPAGFFNAGEKLLFWLVIAFGVALSGSGLLVLFQNLLPGRESMQLALLVHAIAGIGLFALVLGHIYMAVSVKGTLDAITTGEVDANWAEHHHQIWYQEMLEAGQIKQAASDRAAASGSTRTAAGAPHQA